MLILPLPESTIYGDSTTLAYVLSYLRHCDVQIAANLLQLRRIYPSVNHGVAHWADGDEVSKRGRQRLVFSHVAGWFLRCPAPYTVDFAGLALPLILLP